MPFGLPVYPFGPRFFLKNKLPSLSGSLSGPPLDAACSSLFCFFVPSACACSSEVAVTSCSPIPFVSLRGTCILNQRSLSVFENARQQPCKTEDPSEVTSHRHDGGFQWMPPSPNAQAQQRSPQKPGQACLPQHLSPPVRPRRLAQGLGPSSTPLIDQSAPQIFLLCPLVLTRLAPLPVGHADKIVTSK